VAAYRQGAALGLDTFPGHAEADARTLDGPDALCLALKEGFEHSLRVCFGDGITVIGHFDNQHGMFLAPRNLDATAIRSIVDPVG